MMKAIKLSISILVVLLLNSFAIKESTSTNKEFSKLRKIDNKAFQAGEKLEYRLHYGLISAGTATLSVEKSTQKIGDRELLHIIGKGNTNSSFDWMYKVRDRYESYIDADGIFPWMFMRNVDEGGFKINQSYEFAQHKQTVATSEGKIVETPEAVQDMLSSFYYARTIDFSTAKVGEVFTVNSFVDGKVWPLQIRFVGREDLKTNGHKYKTLKFHPVVQTGRMFKHEEDVTVWVSDDNNKIPLLAQGKIFIGSIKMEIAKYEGLANPIAIVE